MNKAIIFDLDDTLVETKEIKHLRQKNWPECYRLIPIHTHKIIPISLIFELKSRNILIGVVTNSPRVYAKKVLAHHNIPYDKLIAFHDVKKENLFPIHC